jgi:hypothetical protein
MLLPVVRHMLEKALSVIQMQLLEPKAQLQDHA